MRDRVVVKVGGSLLDWPGLRGALGRFLVGEGGHDVVLVVGGGTVADSVRALDSAHGIGDKRAHALALRALDLTARMLAEAVDELDVIDRPDAAGSVWQAGRVPVLAPAWFMENVDARAADPLPESWETTTDSIAARLASHLNAARLVLLKSASLASADRQALARSGFLDAAFPGAARGFDRIRVVNLRVDPFQETWI